MKASYARRILSRPSKTPPARRYIRGARLQAVGFTLSLMRAKWPLFCARSLKAEQVTARGWVSGKPAEKLERLRITVMLGLLASLRK